MSFVSQPGTVQSPLTLGGVAYGNGSSVKVSAVGTAGQVLTSNGAAAPTFQTLSIPPSGGSFTATASGALTAGAAVVVNSNGTVSVGAATYSGTWNSPAGTSLTGLAANNNTSATYDPNANAIVVFYGNASNYPTVVVGLINGTTVTWGTPTVVYSSGTANSSYGAKSIYASSSNAHVYVTCDGNYVRYCSVRISSSGAITTLVSVGTIYGPNVTPPAIGGTAGTSFLYDSVNNRLAYFYSSTFDLYTYLSGGTIDATGTFTVNYNVVVDASGISAGPSAAYFDTTGNIGVLFWQNQNNQLWTCAVTLSNTSATLGGSQQVTTYNNNNYSIAVGPQSTGAGALLYSYVRSGASAMQFRAATRSGSTITLGSTSAASTYGFFNQNNSQFLIYGGRTVWANNHQLYVVTVTAGVPLGTFATSSIGGTNEPQNFIQNTIDLNLIQVVRVSASTITPFFYSDVTSNINSNNFVGFSSAAYSNGQTATINAISSVNTSQSGLTPGLKYYVNSSGTLSSTATTQPYAGVALSATSILIKG